MRSKVARSRDSLTRVAASVDLNVSRSVRPTSALAASASSASDVEIRSSARRKSPMNSRIRSSILLRQDLLERPPHAFDVLFVLHEQRQRGLDERGIELAGGEDPQPASPVDRLRDRRRLAQLRRADL